MGHIAPPWVATVWEIYEFVRILLTNNSWLNFSQSMQNSLGRAGTKLDFHSVSKYSSEKWIRGVSPKERKGRNLISQKTFSPSPSPTTSASPTHGSQIEIMIGTWLDSKPSFYHQFHDLLNVTEARCVVILLKVLISLVPSELFTLGLRPYNHKTCIARPSAYKHSKPFKDTCWFPFVSVFLDLRDVIRLGLFNKSGTGLKN